MIAAIPSDEAVATDTNVRQLDAAACSQHREHALIGIVDRARFSATILWLEDSVLHQRACAMAIPMLYAHWEGFAKEVLQLYVPRVSVHRVRAA